ncbi:hypothetical protein PYCCODRAFT_1475026 [Trametes coccinea BRFM310]|uniref:Ser-Thr-rich glycosyl-phosphatidyl-inositol-anchored membrane family-domain-containing protein n=1 Tax=Trametes coccinea (strain BRFM310) TaxID=1353009 RepID=A0A1Y2IYF2_TRAC3|nr:hypothetical protein PYCCODRAFT_1475026 [Trametes coccinea BRFM310]
MFAQLSVLALALAPLASALTLQIPVDWHSSSQVNISWSNTASDPSFSLQLVNTDEFHDTFAIANNLNPSADFASFQLGVIPEGQYTLRAINVTNASQIYDETPSFTILAPLSTSSSAASTSSAASSSGAASASVTGSSTLTVPAASSTSGFGVTVSGSSTGSGSSAGTNTASATDSSSSSVPSSFNGSGNGAASLPRLTPWALAALGVVAGAAAVL